MSTHNIYFWGEIKKTDVTNTLTLMQLKLTRKIIPVMKTYQNCIGAAAVMIILTFSCLFYTLDKIRYLR